MRPIIDKIKEKRGKEQEPQRLIVRNKKAYELWQRLTKSLKSGVVPEDRIQIIVQQIQNYFKSIDHEEGIKLTEKVLLKHESASVVDFDKVRALIHSYWFSENKDVLAHQAHSQDIPPTFMVTLHSAQVLSSKLNTDRIDY
ncbi:MAG: hypothetical protein ACETVR_03630 [Candidatus Bathyarchaeia archaeon]